MILLKPLVYKSINAIMISDSQDCEMYQPPMLYQKILNGKKGLKWHNNEIKYTFAIIIN